eukprot:scaffold15029_cov297-Alexandrium_tamarense.AAC.1
MVESVGGNDSKDVVTNNVAANSSDINELDLRHIRKLEDAIVETRFFLEGVRQNYFNSIVNGC